MSTTGDRIAKLRVENGLTMEQLGNKLGTSKGTVNNWEKNRNNPDRENLKLLSDYFDVSVEYILNGEVDTVKMSTKEYIRYKTKEYLNSDSITAKIELIPGSNEKTKDSIYKKTIADFDNTNPTDVTLETLQSVSSGLEEIDFIYYKNNEWEDIIKQAIDGYINNLIHESLLNIRNKYFNEIELPVFETIKHLSNSEKNKFVDEKIIPILEKTAKDVHEELDKYKTNK